MHLVRRLPPSLYPVIGFLVLILAGAVVLMAIPTTNGSHLAFIDALFMATSATCVTGLAVIDIGTELTLWGQLTLLALIQMGGLGIMTFSTVFILALGHSISFRSRFVMQDIFAHTHRADLHTLLRNVILFTLSFEAVGALLLWYGFSQELEPMTAAYYGLFHAVSAFCNAGLGLFADNLMRYRGDPLVSLTVVILIVAGGIGFMVLHELSGLPGNVRKWTVFWNRLSLHTKMVLNITLWLIAGGTFFFLVSEWSNTLKDLPFATKLLASLFQSVTPRTAGFNTVDIAALNNITLLGMIMLMFIGASPGSTGGGVKTTSMGVLLAMSRARLTGTEHVHAFKRRISDGTINRAYSIFVVSTLIVMLGTAFMLIAEVGNLPEEMSRGRFMEYLFETTSAFGTVGLSMGITPGLSAWSKFTLVLVMYTGRLGPLVVAMAIRPVRQRGAFLYPEEKLMIG
jgi:trk system potassium uptake protein